MNARQCLAVSPSTIAAITTGALPQGVAVARDRRLLRGGMTPAGACSCRRRRRAPAAGHSYQRRMLAVRAVPPAASIGPGGARVLWWRKIGLQAKAHIRVHRGATNGARCSRCSTARLTGVVAVGDKLGERDVSRTASRAGTCRRKHPKVSRSRAAVALIGVKPRWMLGSEVCLYRLAGTVR